jgi:hypothetical protein
MRFLNEEKTKGIVSVFMSLPMKDLLDGEIKSNLINNIIDYNKDLFIYFCRMYNICFKELKIKYLCTLDDNIIVVDNVRLGPTYIENLSVNDIKKDDIRIEKFKELKESLSATIYNDKMNLIEKWCCPDKFNEYVQHRNLAYLGGAIQLLSTADILFSCEPTKDSSGCTIERKCAELYDIPIVYSDKPFDYQ